MPFNLFYIIRILIHSVCLCSGVCKWLFKPEKNGETLRHRWLSITGRVFSLGLFFFFPLQGGRRNWTASTPYIAHITFPVSSWDSILVAMIIIVLRNWGCLRLSTSPPRIAPGDLRSEPQWSSSSGFMLWRRNSICWARSNREWPDPTQSETKSSSVSSHLQQITFYLPPNTGYTHSRTGCMQWDMINLCPTSLFLLFSRIPVWGRTRKSTQPDDQHSMMWMEAPSIPSSVCNKAFLPLKCGGKYPASWTGPSSQYRKMRWWVMFLLLCIDRVVVDAAVSLRGSSMIILSMVLSPCMLWRTL